MSSKMKKLSLWAGKIAVFFLLAIIAVFFIEYYFLPRLSSSKYFSRYEFLKKAGEKVVIINRTEQIVLREGDSVNELVAKFLPSMVNIMSFEDFQGAQKTKAVSAQARSGSGIILSSDGLIATYRSAIIEKNASYKVLTRDGMVRAAKLKAIDEFSNIAFLKIEASNLSAASFANSDDFRAGKKIIAIANSGENYQNHFSSGILGGINESFNIAGQTVSSSEKLEGVFESDFIKEERYVGGPIVSFNGDLVGLTGSILINNQPRYFHIPANVVKKSMDLLIAGELEKRPMLGVYYLSINHLRQAEQNLSRSSGALIYSPRGMEKLAIIAGSPAEKAGLKIRDIITAVNGRDVNADNPLSNLISEIKTGDKAELKVERAGREIIISVQL